jgi:hypothetical protein
MIDATFVQSIADRAAVQTFEVEGATFSSKALHEIKPAPDPQSQKVYVYTLNGFADLVREKFDAINLDDYVVHVTDYNRVKLIARGTDQWGRRLELIEASPVKFDEFKFGQWLDQESFVIAVAAKFAQTDDKDYVLKIASSLTHDATTIAEDNGFSQKATVKVGMKVAENIVVKPQVLLAPYRTFPEIGQPISAFVFRARGGDSPSLMLVEADGGKWKIDAVEEVARKLRVFDLGLPVIA